MNKRERLYQIIFEADTPAGKAFDVVLLWAVLLSVLTVVLESIVQVRQGYQQILIIIEWFFTILFSIEYLLRIYCVGKPLRYMRSFFGIIDLLAILPSYISLFFVDSHYLAVVRAVRLLRIFRVLKLARYSVEAEILMLAIRASRHKITVFIGAVFTVVLIVGSVMYVIEGPEYGFTSIPIGMYWAIVTLTTVGFGDITPHTPLGQTLSAFVMILGYGLIAVPTGIVSVELSHAQKKSATQHGCKDCGASGHDLDARYCKFCGGIVDLKSVEKR